MIYNVFELTALEVLLTSDIETVWHWKSYRYSVVWLTVSAKFMIMTFQCCVWQVHTLSVFLIQTLHVLLLFS